MAFAGAGGLHYLSSGLHARDQGSWIAALRPIEFSIVDVSHASFIWCLGGILFSSLGVSGPLRRQCSPATAPFNDLS